MYYITTAWYDITQIYSLKKKDLETIYFVYFD